MDIKAGDKVVCVESRNPSVTVGKQYDVKIGSRGRLIFENDNGSLYFVESKSVDKGFEFKKVEKITQFKEGDLVFELDFANGIKLEELESVPHSNEVRTRYGFNYMSNGLAYSGFKLPHLMHATPENREKLVAIWGEDAVPKLPLRGSELTKKLLESQKMQACLCDDDNDHMALNSGELRLIIEFSGGYFYDIDGNGCKSAVSVDNQGNEITELPESCDETD